MAYIDFLLSSLTQTTGLPGATHDALVVLRADLAGGGSPLTQNKPSIGAMAARLLGARANTSKPLHFMTWLSANNVGVRLLMLWMCNHG